MTDLTTARLQHLLDQATTGPWETIEAYPDGTPRWDMSRQIRSADGEYLGIMHGQNAHLAALAPELAQEVINLRDALGYLVEETRLAAENSDDAVVQKRVADAIKTTVAKIQGDHDE